MIEANFTSYVLELFRLIEQKGDELVRDIASGTISPSISMPENVRAELEGLMKPDLARSTAVAAALRAHKQRQIARAAQTTVSDGSDGSGAGAGPTRSLCTDLWPHLQVILSVNTGQFAPHGRQLRRWYLPGPDQLPIYSPMYAATEGLLGVNRQVRDVLRKVVIGGHCAGEGQGGIRISQQYIHRSVADRFNNRHGLFHCSSHGFGEHRCLHASQGVCLFFGMQAQPCLHLCRPRFRAASLRRVA